MLRASRCVAQGSDAGVGTVIAYCTIGVRSGFFVRSLRRRGVNAVNMAGSILSWCHAGGELVDGVTGAPTNRVHVYGATWYVAPSRLSHTCAWARRLYRRGHAFGYRSIRLGPIYPITTGPFTSVGLF